MQGKPSTSTEAQVHEFIVRAREIADARLESVTSSRLAELGERLERRDFNVAVLGEFKRGKSSLVNALLGVPVLPTGVLPLTSVVTRRRWESRKPRSRPYLPAQRVRHRGGEPSEPAPRGCGRGRDTLGSAPERCPDLGHPGGRQHLRAQHRDDAALARRRGRSHLRDRG